MRGLIRVREPTPTSYYRHSLDVMLVNVPRDLCGVLSVYLTCHAFLSIVLVTRAQVVELVQSNSLVQQASAS